MKPDIAFNLLFDIDGKKIQGTIIDIDFRNNVKGRAVTNRALEIKYLAANNKNDQLLNECILTLIPENCSEEYLENFESMIRNEIKKHNSFYEGMATFKIEVTGYLPSELTYKLGMDDFINCYIFINNEEIIRFKLDQIRYTVIKNTVNKDIKKDISFEFIKYVINNLRKEVSILMNLFSGKVLYLTHTTKEHTDNPFLFISVLGNDSLEGNVIKEYEIYYKPTKKYINLFKSIMKKILYHNLINIKLEVEDPEKMITMHFNGLRYNIKYEEFKVTTRTPIQDELDGKGFPYISEDNNDNIKEIDPMELIEPDTPKDKENDYDTFTKLKLFMESIVSNSDSMISHLDLPDVDNIQVKFKNGIIIDKTILDAE